MLESFPQDSVSVRLDDSRTGFVNRQHLFLGPPEPKARLYRTKPGDTALGIAQGVCD